VKNGVNESIWKIEGGEIMTLIIGIDYGISRNDKPMFSAIKKENNKIIMIDSGKMEEFNYEKYVVSEHQIVGDKKDAELFKIQFLNEN
jgi:hypothetical protein